LLAHYWQHEEEEEMRGRIMIFPMKQYFRVSRQDDIFALNPYTK
jgi:hypothetical protein